MGNICTSKHHTEPFQWKELAPFKYTKYAHPIPINSDEFVVIPANATTKWWSHSSDGIYKYNIPNNEWSLFIPYPSPIFRVAMINVISNKPLDQMKLNKNTTPSKDEIIVPGYIRLLSSDTEQEIPLDIILLILKFYELDDCIHCFEGSKMIQINLNSQEFTQHETNYAFGDCPGVVNKDGIFHIVGGRNNSKHVRYRDNTDPMKMEEIFDGFDQKTFCNMGLIYIETQNCILLLGGYEPKSYDAFINTIWKYYIDQDEWIKMEDVRLNGNVGLCAFGYVLSNCERYLIIFGGMGLRLRDEILVLDVVEMEWIEMRNRLKLPFSGVCHAVIMPNDDVYILKDGRQYTINVKDIIDVNH